MGHLGSPVLLKPATNGLPRLNVKDAEQEFLNSGLDLRVHTTTWLNLKSDSWLSIKELTTGKKDKNSFEQ